jgi:hypothetical protein
LIFGEEVKYLHQFLVLQQKIVFGESMAGIFDRHFTRFRPIYLWPFEIKKLGIFSIFSQIWQLFFLQNAILRKIGPGTIKNGFYDIV